MIERVHEEIAAAARAVSSLDDAAEEIVRIAQVLIRSLRDGGTVFFAGNGGSAADAQHLAAELAGRFLLERKPLPAIALTTNTSALTAIANDYGYEQVFARQLRAQARAGDVLVLISTSGTSPNILAALDAADELSCDVIVLTGPKGRELASRAHAALVIGEGPTPHVQEAHIAAGHIVCGLVESELAED